MSTSSLCHLSKDVRQGHLNELAVLPGEAVTLGRHGLGLAEDRLGWVLVRHGVALRPSIHTVPDSHRRHPAIAANDGHGLLCPSIPFPCLACHGLAFGIPGMRGMVRHETLAGEAGIRQGGIVRHTPSRAFGECVQGILCLRVDRLGLVATIVDWNCFSDNKPPLQTAIQATCIRTDGYPPTSGSCETLNVVAGSQVTSTERLPDCRLASPR